MNPDEQDTAKVTALIPPPVRRTIPSRRKPYEGFDENWWSDPSQRYRALARTAMWTFVPHARNAATRKIVTSILMGTWSMITVGKAFGYADTGQMYPYVSMLVFAIVCTIWGFELGMLDNVAGGIERREDAKRNAKSHFDEEEKKDD